MSDDYEGDTAPESGPDRRRRINNEAVVVQRLEDILRWQRDFRRDMDKLREEFSKDVQGGTERMYLIKRIEERVNEMFVRLMAVEASYVRKEEHERDMAPFRKYAGWLSTLVIGAVITAVLATVLNKGGIH